MDKYIALYNYEKSSPSSQAGPDRQPPYIPERFLDACLDKLNDIYEHEVNVGPYRPVMQQILTPGNCQHTTNFPTKHQNLNACMQPWHFSKKSAYTYTRQISIASLS